MRLMAVKTKGSVTRVTPPSEFRSPLIYGGDTEAKVVVTAGFQAVAKIFVRDLPGKVVVTAHDSIQKRVGLMEGQLARLERSKDLALLPTIWKLSG